MCEVYSKYSSMSVDSYWETVNILIKKFNVINKRLWGSKIVFRSTCKPKYTEWDAPLRSLSKLNNKRIENNFKCLLADLELTCDNNSANVEVILIELLPKKFTYNKGYQLVCLDKVKITSTFYDVTPEQNNYSLCPNFTYSLSLQNENLVLKINNECNIKSKEWLINTLLPQLIKWGKHEITPSFSIIKDSLTLVSRDKYYTKYNELKNKYGKNMVEIWPEGTDPSKYVYEDVAIATYILLLWEKDEIQQKKTFVDLGCGNGLLVYILTEEGHNGIGIDVRKRQIWGIYPKHIKLEQRTIIPYNDKLFPEADWVIGNHSDELTPWIPVIAARNSYKCNFFVLPCCAYNFDGTKYQRKDSSKSQYTEYLEYIKTICDLCGFKTSIDRLKIPSTKRTCLIGEKRTYLQDDHSLMCTKIQKLFNNNSSDEFENDDAYWLSNFKPRDAVEKVRNCTKMDKTIINNVIDTICKHLLQDYDREKKWSIGKAVNINEIVTLISKDDLQAMKSECGGLQTLIKNNHHIFRVEKGKVQLRYPRTIEEVKKSNSKNDKSKTTIKVKLKPCWFYKNHPQGCPLPDTICSYFHV